jgi:hypothetical protein
VDFLITDKRRPTMLVEAKLSDSEPSPALRYFAERLSAKWAIQLVRRAGTPTRVSDGVTVVSADRFLALL